MIRCNLAVLLAERGIKMAKVSEDTGISRTTLTSLSANKCEGVHLNTLNTLCLYLKVSPADILSYLPYDLQVTHISVTGSHNIGIDMDFTEQRNKVTFTVAVRLEFQAVTTRGGKVKGEKLFIYMDKLENTELGTCTIATVFANMPRTFLSDVEGAIKDTILSNTDTREIIDKVVNIDDVSMIFIWNDRFFH